MYNKRSMNLKYKIFWNIFKNKKQRQKRKIYLYKNNKIK